MKKLTESILTSLKEELDGTSYSSIVNRVLDGEEVYIKLDDYFDDSNIYKVEVDQVPQKPEDYDEGYTSGWNRGEDEEFDRVQDERFNKATEAYNNGEVFNINCVRLHLGEIEYTGTTAATLYGTDELEEYLKDNKVKVLKVKTTQSFEESVKLNENDMPNFDEKLAYICDKYSETYKVDSAKVKGIFQNLVVFVDEANGNFYQAISNYYAELKEYFEEE